MKILYAEDEIALREVVEEYLTYQGHHVTSVSDGAQAVEAATDDAFDVIIMDIMMPVKDGLTAMREIRVSGDRTPALFLSAKGEISDRVEGLDAGADDYMTKPFALEELSARLRALARRKRNVAQRILSYGNAELDMENAELRAHNSIALAIKEVRLLEILFMHPDQSVSTETLLQEIWDNETVNPNVVWIYITFLRAKLRSIHADFSIIGNQNEAFSLERKNEIT